MDDRQDDKMSRSRTIRKSMREAFGLKKQKLQFRKIDSRLSEYFRDIDNAACQVSEDKIAKVRARIESGDCSAFKDADIALALVSDYSAGDPDKAFDLLVTLERAEAGIIEPYSPDVKLVGAVNRNAITCWLDSVLFAMFVRSDDFEPMLFHTFEEAPKRRLAILIRLWINLLRTGKLITPGTTQQIQETLADCGWPEAAGKQQQDASEAFGRLTEFLNLPPLTLKKDMFHQGKADQDDHKFTHERTIDIGIPPAREDGAPIKLEDCLENYFDETVQVNRQKEEYARRNTVGAASAKMEEAESEIKNKALHIEVAEVVETSSPTTLTPSSPLPAYSDGRPHLTEIGRVPSIFSERKVDGAAKPLSPTRKGSLPNPQRKRSATIGKQVQMRAFQFFRLIPWYTEGNPNTDLQVAQHFESKRPAVGICLKRFVATDDSGTKWTKRKDFVDIPIESGIPSFLHDDDLGDEIFPNWKFKLSLQSVICHRGDSLERGHYISIARAGRPRGKAPIPGAENIPHNGSTWVMHDDLAKPSRVRYVDVEKALKEETPYLLFYKIVLMEGETNPGRISTDGRPPSYSSADSDSRAYSNTSPTGSSRPSQNGAATLSTAPSLTRAKSDTSSVLSNTPGPPLSAQAVGGDSVVRTQENGQTILAQTSGASLPVPHPGHDSRSQSAPANDSSHTPAAGKENVEQQDASKMASDGGQPRSRPSTASNSGSLSRLSQMFRPPPTSPSPKDSRDRISVDLGTRKSVDIPRPHISLESESALAVAQNQAEGQPVAAKSFRKSMDEIRLSRRKEKEKDRGHRRERSIGDKLKSRRSERPDRECVLM